mgnify:CR=1 FL=1
MKDTVKKGKVTMAVAISLACFALIAVMCMQFKIVNQTNITEIENMRETELRTQLANWKQKYEETQKKYEETQNMLEEYKKTRASNEETEKIVDAELQQVNQILGKTDVEGEGIQVVLKEVEDSEMGNIKADSLLIIVNALKSAGAEAICINEERVVNMTDIVTINDSFIKVNGQRILAPYVIKAIGNQTYMESALLGNGGSVDELKKLGYDVSIEKINRLKIKKYQEDIKIKYME